MSDLKAPEAGVSACIVLCLANLRGQRHRSQCCGQGARQTGSASLRWRHAASLLCGLAALYVATIEAVLLVGHVVHYADPQLAAEARMQLRRNPPRM